MPIKAIRIDKETDVDPVIELDIGGRIISIPYADLVGTRLENESTLIQLLQLGIDERIRINRLPKDDPDRDTDPNRETFFHDGQWLVAREAIVVAAPWDGEKYLLTIRRARNVPRI